MHDILKSRCIGKALEAIKCCERINKLEVALRMTLDKLEKYFGSSSLIIKLHLSHISKSELVKWNIDSFQAFINEL